MKVLFVSPGWQKGSLWGELAFKFPTLSLASIAAVTPPEWDVALLRRQFRIHRLTTWTPISSP